MKSWQTFYTRKSNGASTVTFLFGATVLLALLSLCLGPVAIEPGEVIRTLTGRGGDGTAKQIIWFVRLPRTCGCLLAGAALAVSGSILQSVLSNSLAAPNVIGVNAGAGLAVALCCAAMPTAVVLTPIAAFSGAFGGAMLVLFLAERTGASKITVVLAGMAVSSIFNAGIDVVITLVPDALNGYSDFRIGGFAHAMMSRIAPASWIILAGIILACSLHNELDLLSLGSETAQSLGLSVRSLRVLFLALSAALAGAAVSFSGLLGFVGLLVPHMARSIVGEENHILLPVTALGGAAMLTACDLLARILFSPFEFPVGIVMSMVGGPFFIWLLLRQRGGRIHD